MNLQIEITELGRCNSSANYCPIPRVEIVTLPSIGDDDADLVPITEFVGARGFDLR